MFDHCQLPPELWLEILSWATYNPIMHRLEGGHIQPFQSLSYPRNARDINLETSASISMVCKTWKQWVAQALYRDLRVRSNLRTLKHALQKVADGDPQKRCGEMVRRRSCAGSHHVVIKPCMLRCIEWFCHTPVQLLDRLQD